MVVAKVTIQTTCSRITKDQDVSWMFLFLQQKKDEIMLYVLTLTTQTKTQRIASAVFRHDSPLTGRFGNPY